MEEYYEKNVIFVYKELFKECLKVFNEMFNCMFKYIKSKDIYVLVRKIDELLN